MNIDWPNALVGVALGTTLGFATSYYFAAESSKELQAEATQLRRLNELMLQGMENAGWMKLNRNAEGKITGMIIELEAHAEVSKGEFEKLVPLLTGRPYKTPSE